MTTVPAAAAIPPAAAPFSDGASTRNLRRFSTKVAVLDEEEEEETLPLI
jgi:hypothetical protein